MSNGDQKNALKGHDILAQGKAEGDALGSMSQKQPPCKGKAIATLSLALTGRQNLLDVITQGGGEYALPWAKMRSPSRAKTR